MARPLSAADDAQRARAYEWNQRFNWKLTAMSSMHRTIEGEVLVRHLTRDERLIDPALLARNGRTARTIVKEGPLRLTIIAIAAGGELPTHSTDGPVSIHVLEGEVTFEAVGCEYPLTSGELLVLAPGVPHSARSATGVLFLLTVVHTPSAGSRQESPELDAEG